MKNKYYIGGGILSFVLGLTILLQKVFLKSIYIELIYYVILIVIVCVIERKLSKKVENAELLTKVVSVSCITGILIGYGIFYMFFKVF